MVAGSFASSAHGMPRATQDVDLVIDPPSPAALDTLIRSMAPEQYYVDLEAARDALRRRSMFNVVDLASGWKVDLILRKDRPFSRDEFARRMKLTLLDVSVFVATPEDTIVAKLEWSKLAGGSERQRRDVCRDPRNAGGGDGSRPHRAVGSGARPRQRVATVAGDSRLSQPPRRHDQLHTGAAGRCKAYRAEAGCSLRGARRRTSEAALLPRPSPR